MCQPLGHKKVQYCTIFYLSASQHEHSGRSPGHGHKFAQPVVESNQHLARVLHYSHVHCDVRDMPELLGECGEEVGADKN